MGLISGAIALGAAAMGASANKKAAKTVAAGAQQTADQNNAIQREIRTENKGYLSPFMTRGNAAGESYNALLGLGGDPAKASQAFDTFRGSTGYDFRMGQGVDAINQNNVTGGLLKSGKALKDLTTFGQGIGSQEFGNYMGYLGNQQQAGLSAANALAGVGTNYAGAVGANNNAAANATGNAALVGANNTNALLGNLVQGAGMWAGQRQSSYGGPPPVTAQNPWMSQGWQI